MKTLLITAILLASLIGYSQTMVTNCVTNSTSYYNMHTGELSKKITVTTNITAKVKLSDMSTKDNVTFTRISTNSATAKLTKIDMGPKYTSAGASSTVRTHYNIGGIGFTRVSGSGVRGGSRWE